MIAAGLKQRAFANSALVGLEPHGEQHIRAGDHGVDGEHPESGGAIGEDEVVPVSDAIERALEWL
jgi:hypothetical protein